MISIIIPTFNNLDYLKLCISSIEKNSFSVHEIIIHINDGSDGTLEYVKSKKFKYTFSKNNIGLCTSINLASKLCETKYLLYSHDDMYFCPDWDKHLINEVDSIGHDNFYLSGTMIEPFSGHITFNCGDNINVFDEKKLLNNFHHINFYDHQGTHFAPHLVSKRVWDLVGGFSEEFNPGIGSDPDFNMKLWRIGIRIFKGLNNFKVYHFSSITTRKKINMIQNKGDITFLKKWGISTKFFKKHYLKSRTKFCGELVSPSKDFSYYFELFLDKLKLLKYYFKS